MNDGRRRLTPLEFMNVFVINAAGGFHPVTARNLMFNAPTNK